MFSFGINYQGYLLRRCSGVMPTTADWHHISPNTKRNPNPSPIGFGFGFILFGAGKRTWTFTKLPPLEPESSASANSAIPACLKCMGNNPTNFYIKQRLIKAVAYFSSIDFYTERCLRARGKSLYRKNKAVAIATASLVRETGLEPVRCNPHAPQTCASASSATPA